MIDGIISEWCRKAGCKDYLVLASFRGNKTFRHNLYKKYKSNRKGREVPELLKDADRLIVEDHPSKNRKGLEADDLMGLYATNGDFDKPIIITVDKDLRTIPGLHFNPDKLNGIERVTPEEAHMNFCRQWITGDPGDGYPGIPGIGPKKAAVYLEDLHDACDKTREAAVQAAYKDNGCKFAYCVQMGRLAKILSAREIDAAGNITHWEPKKARCWSP